VCFLSFISSYFALATMEVLFIGNSFTYYNDLPQMVKTLCAEIGVDIKPTSHLAGGESLCGHANNPKVAELISKKYDIVILQDHSQAPTFTDVRTKTIKCLEDFYRPHFEKAGTKNVILYHTWGRREGTKTFNGFETMQKALDDGYEQYAKALSSSLFTVRTAPVGPSFGVVYHRSQPNPLEESSLFFRLYDDDSSHPSPIGSYIAACCMFTYITGKSPVGLVYRPRSVSEEERSIVQNIVAKVWEEKNN